MQQEHYDRNIVAAAMKGVVDDADISGNPLNMGDFADIADNCAAAVKRGSGKAPSARGK